MHEQNLSHASELTTTRFNIVEVKKINTNLALYSKSGWFISLRAYCVNIAKAADEWLYVFEYSLCSSLSDLSFWNTRHSYLSSIFTNFLIAEISVYFLNILGGYPTDLSIITCDSCISLLVP